MQPKKNVVKTRPTFQKLHKINAQTIFEKANRIVVIYKKHTLLNLSDIIFLWHARIVFRHVYQDILHITFL